MDAQVLQDPEKVSAIWVKNLNSIVKSWCIEIIFRGEFTAGDGFYRSLYQSGKKHGGKKDVSPTSCV